MSDDKYRKEQIMIFDLDNARLRRVTCTKEKEFSFYSTNQEKVQLFSFQNLEGKAPFFFQHSNHYTINAIAGTRVIFLVGCIKYLLIFVKEEEHEDMLSNYSLPSSAQLQASAFPGTHVSITELLLDFRTILQHKGKDTIEKVLEFLGYNIDLVNQLDSVGNKTGIYIAELLAYLEQGLDENNLPEYEYTSTSDDLLDALQKALQLVHEYFSAEEQIVKETHLIHQSNLPNFIQINTQNYCHSTIDQCLVNFRFDIENFVKDCKLHNDKKKLFLQRYLDPLPSLTIHEVLPYTPTEQIDLIHEDICYLLHLKLKGDNVFYSIKVNDLQYTGDTSSVSFDKWLVVLTPQDIHIELKIRNQFGSVESLNYDLHLREISNPLHVLSSAEVSQDSSMDIYNSPAQTLQEVISYGLPNYYRSQEDVPQDLSEYYSSPYTRYLKNVHLPDLKPTYNYPLKLLSNLPLTLLEPKIHIVTCEWHTGDTFFYLNHGLYSDEFIPIHSYLPINIHSRTVNIDGTQEDRTIFVSSIAGYDVPIDRIYVKKYYGQNYLKLKDIIQEESHTAIYSNIKIDFPEDCYYTYTGPYSTIKSIFSYLTENSQRELKLGDLLICATDKPIPYSLTDSFTGEVLAETDQRALVYRISELTSYDLNSQPIASSIKM